VASKANPRSVSTALRTPARWWFGMSERGRVANVTEVGAPGGPSILRNPVTDWQRTRIREASSRGEHAHRERRNRHSGVVHGDRPSPSSGGTGATRRPESTRRHGGRTRIGQPSREAGAHGARPCRRLATEEAARTETMRIPSGRGAIPSADPVARTVERVRNPVDGGRREVLFGARRPARNLSSDAGHPRERI